MPILSTGGYNDTFLKFISNVFNSKIVKCRDLTQFVIAAIDYLNRWTNDCFFDLDRASTNKLNYAGRLLQEKPPIQQHFSLGDELYPYLLVNLRSGTSFIRVESKTEYRRLQGSPIGANLFLGALRILNYFNDPSEALGAALVGDSSKTDLSVGDIYGGAYQGIGLPSDLVASSFGKLQKDKIPS